MRVSKDLPQICKEPIHSYRVAVKDHSRGIHPTDRIPP